ncbi:MAG: 8-oxo-dGTP diphosphatase [Spirochaetales bacterium]|jgi:8-oxo-dGTP diphosphatase|nr:8-oxo-dGTP diphosphatase [Spirochaetales bacterium]
MVSIQDDSAPPGPQTVEEINWKEWQPSERAVIVYIVDRPGNKVLLILKKQGLGAGKINAPGGRLEPGETSLQAAVRECQEEVGLTPLNGEKRMELHFQFTSGYALYGEAFVAEAWEGELKETDEAAPFWCDLDDLPWDKMWEDDRHWLPGALGGDKQRGYYIFDDDRMLSMKQEKIKP